MNQTLWSSSQPIIWPSTCLHAHETSGHVLEETTDGLLGDLHCTSKHSKDLNLIAKSIQDASGQRGELSAALYECGTPELHLPTTKLVVWPHCLLILVFCVNTHLICGCQSLMLCVLPCTKEQIAALLLGFCPLHLSCSNCDLRNFCFCGYCSCYHPQLGTHRRRKHSVDSPAKLTPKSLAFVLQRLFHLFHSRWNWLTIVFAF